VRGRCWNPGSTVPCLTRTAGKERAIISDPAHTTIDTASLLEAGEAVVAEVGEEVGEEEVAGMVLRPVRSDVTPLITPTPGLLLRLSLSLSLSLSLLVTGKFGFFPPPDHPIPNPVPFWVLGPGSEVGVLYPPVKISPTVRAVKAKSYTLLDPEPDPDWGGGGTYFALLVRIVGSWDGRALTGIEAATTSVSFSSQSMQIPQGEEEEEEGAELIRPVILRLPQYEERRREERRGEEKRGEEKRGEERRREERRREEKRR
jgi:hypothetical protein